MKRQHRTPGARELALQALTAVDQEGAYSNLALNEVLLRHRPEPREAALVTELVYGTIQRRNTLDGVLDRHIAKGIRKLQPWVRSLFRLSAYQLLYLDRIPPHAAVSEAVSIAKRRGHAGISGLVNAVLRKLAANPGLPVPPANIGEAERIAFVHSHPEWLVRRWVQHFGVERAEDIAAANNRPPNVSIRANRLRTSREELLAALTAAGIEASPSSVSADGIVVESGGNMAHTKWYAEGDCTIQDESSMLVGALLNPEPGMNVLDCCAAPGGKTTHLAELMNNKGTVVACDVHPHKRELIEGNARRLGLDIVQAIVEDAAALHMRFADHSFDRILLDAPCSGFGVIRRKPDIKWTKSERDVRAIVDLQRTILSSVHRLLKPGGVLVYSTCTLGEEENERQISAFLADHSEYTPDPTVPERIPAAVVERCRSGEAMLNVLPSDFESDGFFMARLRKS